MFSKREYEYVMEIAKEGSFQKQPRNSIFPSRRSAVRLKRLRKSYMGSRFLTGM